MKHIALIAGTNRPNSRSLQAATHIEELYQAEGATTRLLDLSTLPPEIFLPSVYQEKPASFTPWMDAITDSAGIVVVVPEYNGSFPGALKYFIDMLPFPESFEGRPVCFVGLASGSWGALRAVEHLQGVFGYRNAHIYPRRVFLPGIHASIDQAGRFLPELEKRLKEQTTGFLDYVRRLQG